MLKKRIIPCLDIREGRTVKGVQFESLREAGDPVALAANYARLGADELVLLDITATIEGRSTFVRAVEEVARAIDIPFTVGGGIRTPEEVYHLLRAGADKVSVNSAAVKHPELITTLAREFGSQCVVVAIDAAWHPYGSEVYVHGGRKPTGIAAAAWAAESQQRGAGEILLTSIRRDGTKSGFDLELLREVSSASTLPLIASGGAGNAAHFAEVFEHSAADAALAAGIFHFGELSITDLKQFLKQANIPVR